jgi:hypothetical protein
VPTFLVPASVILHLAAFARARHREPTLAPSRSPAALAPGPG